MAKIQLKPWDDQKFLFGSADHPTEISIEQAIVITLENGKQFCFSAKDIKSIEEQLFMFKHFVNKDKKQCSFKLGPVLSKEESGKTHEQQASEAYAADLAQRLATKKTSPKK